MKNMTMKQMLIRIFTYALLCAASLNANAQFSPGQVLTAAQLNAALAAPNITGGTITGLSSPLPVASGGTGATSASAARANLGAASTGANTFTGSQTLALANPSLNISDSSAGTSRVAWQISGTPIWAAVGDSVTSQWRLQRYVAGVLTDNPIAVSNSTGAVTLSLPAALASPARTDSSNSLATTFFVQDRLGNPPCIGCSTPAPGMFTTLTSTAGVQLPIAAVASLPTCNSSSKGMLYAVSDATSPTYNGTLTGGGAVSVPVYCNGTAWTSH